MTEREAGVKIRLVRNVDPAVDLCLTRIPCVGEFIALTSDDEQAGRWIDLYKVTRVVHVLDDPSVSAEVWAVEDPSVERAPPPAA